MMVWLRPPSLLPALVGAAAICVVAFALVRMDHYGAASMTVLVLLSLLFAGAGRIRPEVDLYAALPPVLVTALLAVSIGSASCRGMFCQYVEISGVAGLFK